MLFSFLLFVSNLLIRNGCCNVTVPVKGQGGCTTRTSHAPYVQIHKNARNYTQLEVIDQFPVYCFTVKVFSIVVSISSASDWQAC